MLSLLHLAQRPYALLLLPLGRAPRNRLVEIDRCKVVCEQFAVLVSACGDALADEFGQRIAEMILRLKRSCALNQRVGVLAQDATAPPGANRAFTSS